MTHAPLVSSQVVAEDLERMCERLSDSLEALSSRRLLLSGGAGFLGYYLVSTIVAWNRSAPSGGAVELTVWDNFVRGVPPWLEAASSEPHVHVEERDVTQPVGDGLRRRPHSTWTTARAR